jgi:hypothetical protein
MKLLEMNDFMRVLALTDESHATAQGSRAVERLPFAVSTDSSFFVAATATVDKDGDGGEL